MRLTHWLRPLAARLTRSARKPRPRPARRLAVECLEDRSVPSGVQLTDPGVSIGSYLTAVGSSVYFVTGSADPGDEENHSTQLWRNNGQPGGTTLVDTGGKPLDFTSQPSVWRPNKVAAGPWLYFFTYDGDGNYTLRRTGGDMEDSESEPLETFVSVFPEEPGPRGGPSGLTAFGPTQSGHYDVYYTAYKQDTDYKLYRTAGATGITTAITLLDAPASSVPNKPWVTSSYVYVSTFSFNSGGQHEPVALYGLDAAAGASVAVPVPPVPASAPGEPSLPFIQREGGDVQSYFMGSVPTAIGSDLYFRSRDAVFPPNAGIWRLTSPSQAPQFIPTLGPSLLDGSAENAAFHMTPVGDSLYFTTRSPSGFAGYSLWEYDSTAPVNPDPTAPGANPKLIQAFEGRFPVQMVAVRADLYFSDSLPANNQTGGQPRLWKWSTTATPGSAELIESLPTFLDVGIQSLTPVGSSLYFQFGSETNQLEGVTPEGWWRTAGTVESAQPVTPGVVAVSDYLAYPSGWDPNTEATAVIDSTLYFIGNDGENGWGLWRLHDILGHDGMQEAIDGEPPIDPVTGNPTITVQGDTQAQADDFLALFLDPATPGFTPLEPPAGATSPTDIVVTFPAGVVINGAALDIPAGIRVRINGGEWRDGSPALTLRSGELIVAGATFINGTPAPTILVTGGRLVIRNSTIEESTGSAQAAVRVTGGTLDLGTATDPGGNTLNVNGAGTLLLNQTGTAVTAFGNHWTSNGDAAPPSTLVVGPVVWGATPTVTVTGGSFVYDGLAHPATGSVTGTGGEDLGAPTLTYYYRDEDGNWILTGNGGADVPVEPGYYKAVASFAGTDDYQSATATAEIVIAFEARSLTDLSKAFKAGRAIPIKLMLLDADGNNISSPDTDVTATRLERVNADGSRTQVELEDSGNSNPDGLFRYDAALGGYIFNLSTKGLGAGTYDFTWMAEGDPTERKLSFKLN